MFDLSDVVVALAGGWFGVAPGELPWAWRRAALAATALMVVAALSSGA